MYMYVCYNCGRSAQGMGTRLYLSGLCHNYIMHYSTHSIGDVAGSLGMCHLTECISKCKSSII